MMVVTDRSKAVLPSFPNECLFVSVCLLCFLAIYIHVVFLSWFCAVRVAVPCVCCVSCIYLINFIGSQNERL